MSEMNEIRAAVLKATMLEQQHRELTALANPTAAERAMLEDLDESLLVKWDLEKGKAWLSGYIAGPTTESVRRMLLSFAKAKSKAVELNINSWGGIAYEGIAIYNMIRDSEVVVNTRAIGKAYSAASLVFEAGAQRTIATGASLGVHKAWLLAIGNSDEMLHVAERLEGMDERLLEIYTERAGEDRAEEIAALVKKDVMLGAKEAYDVGLADAVEKRSAPAPAPKSGKPANKKMLGPSASLPSADPADQPASAAVVEESAGQPKAEHRHSLVELGGLAHF